MPFAPSFPGVAALKHGAGIKLRALIGVTGRKTKNEGAADAALAVFEARNPVPGKLDFEPSSSLQSWKCGRFWALLVELLQKPRIT
jgi:hypothetical protein